MHQLNGKECLTVKAVHVLSKCPMQSRSPVAIWQAHQLLQLPGLVIYFLLSRAALEAC